MCSWASYQTDDLTYMSGYMAQAPICLWALCGRIEVDQPDHRAMYSVFIFFVIPSPSHFVTELSEVSMGGGKGSDHLSSLPNFSILYIFMFLLLIYN